MRVCDEHTREKYGSMSFMTHTPWFLERIIGWAERRIRLPGVGLDISDRSIKYVKFEEGAGGRLTLASFGQEEIPEGVVVKGEIRSEDTLAKALSGIAAREKRAFRSSGIVASLPEEKSFVRIFPLPKITDAEIGNAIRWKIEEQIPLPAQEIAYDYTPTAPVSPGEDHRDAMVIAFPKEVVASYVRVIANAGMIPTALELESQAIVRSSAPTDAPAGETYLAIDMGRTRTSIIIVSAGAIIFTTTIPVGGAVFEAEIARALGVDAAEALRIKKETGFDKNAYDGKVASALAPALSSLVGEVKRAGDYWRDYAMRLHRGAQAPSRIILSGGDANLLGLDTFLSHETLIPVLRADPLARIRSRMSDAIPPMTHNQSLGFAAAIGLAMRAMPLT